MKSAVVVFPVAAVMLLAAWIVRVQIGPSVLPGPTPVTLAAAPSVSLVQKDVEAAIRERRVSAADALGLNCPSPL